MARAVHADVKVGRTVGAGGAERNHRPTADILYNGRLFAVIAGYIHKERSPELLT
jgi:hypothetical protein